MLDEARYWAETQFGTADLGDAVRDGRPWGCQTHPPAREHHGGDRPGPRRELAATARLARQHQGGIPAVRLWGCQPARPSWTPMSRTAAPRRRGIRSS